MRIDFSRSQEHLTLVFILNTLLGNETKHIFLLDVYLEYPLECPVILCGIHQIINVDTFWDRKPDVYVLNSTSTTLRKVLRTIGRSFNYNPNAKFILLQKSNEHLNHVGELSRYFFSSIDIIRDEQSYFEEKDRVTITNNENSTECSIHYKGSLSIPYDLPDYLKSWRHSGFTICFFDETVPPYSLYTVYENGSRNSGLGFDTADMILQRFNITRIDRVLSGSDLSPDSLKNWLTSGMCDMVLSPLIIDDGLLDFIFPINDDELIWFVPSPSKVPKWKYVTRVFSMKIWMIWLVTVSLSTLFWFIGRKVQLAESARCHSSIKPNEVIGKFFIFSLKKIAFTTQLFLEQGRAASGKYFFQLAFMMTVILPTLAFNMMYKTGFTSLLLGHDFLEESIKSLDDIVDQRLSVSFAEWRLSAFEGTPEKVKKYFKTHNTECETISICVQRMSVNKDLALLMSIENVRYDFDNFLDESGHSVIRPVYPRFLKSLYGSILLKGNPFIHLMTKYTTRLRDHGFIAFILSKYDRQYLTLEAPEDKKLTMEHLWGPFSILIFGTFISFLSFTLESFIDFLKKKKNQTQDFTDLQFHRIELKSCSLFDK